MTISEIQFFTFCVLPALTIMAFSIPANIRLINLYGKKKGISLTYTPIDTFIIGLRLSGALWTNPQDSELRKAIRSARRRFLLALLVAFIGFVLSAVLSELAAK